MADKYIDGNKFVSMLKSGQQDMRLVLLFGEEDYYIDQCVKMAKKTFISPGSEDMDLNVIPQDAKVGFEALEEYAQMPPWMNPRRLIVVKSTYMYDKEFDENALRILENIPDSCVVMFVIAKADKKRKITKYILKNGIAVQIDHFADDALTGIITTSLGKYGIQISADTAQSLINRCDSSLRLIHNELEKLKLFCAETGRKEVTFDDLEDLCPPDLNASIFTITDCFGSGKADNALKTLDSLLARKEALQRIKATMFTHLKRLIIAKDIGDDRRLASEMGFNPKYASNLTKQSARFPGDKLTELYFKAIEMESELRHGTGEERTSLEALIVKASLKQKS
ncbi:DNA polymerase III, delta subunit [Ruminococcaceae bacterium YRB3002]|nr:DNA polymerase III, delta subunit [Ruminococcaceae bacterium YRB3002]